MPRRVKNHLLVVMVLLLGIPQISICQHSISLGTDIPLQYKIGYHYQINEKFSAQGNFGILTSPYDAVILSIMESLGASETITNTLEKTFQFGLIYELGMNYHVNKWFVNPKFQIIHLTSANTSQQDVERVIGQGLPAPRRAGNNDLNLSSTLYQAGFEVGRLFPLQNDRSFFRLGIGGSFNIGSKSDLSSDQRPLDVSNRLLNSELEETYQAYAIPISLNVSYVHIIK